MAWDPNQGQGQEQPGVGGQDPSSGYGTPQNPYGTPPPQNPYGGTPPPQYGFPPNQQGSYGYGYASPQQPRPLGQAIRDLPNQYRNVLSHPSDQTFAVEMVKADWTVVWAQLLILVVVGVVLGLISGVYVSAQASQILGTPGLSSSAAAFTVATSVGGAFLRIIFIPAAFFIGVGVQYALAKAFNGQGTFLAQSYTHLLFKTPLDIIGYIFSTIFVFIPGVGTILGGLVSLALLVYAVVLNIFQIKAVHRLSTGNALAVVLIPLAAFLLLACILSIAFAALIIGIMGAGQHP
jgi:Yip1 domain